MQRSYLYIIALSFLALQPAFAEEEVLMSGTGTVIVEDAAGSGTSIPLGSGAFIETGSSIHLGSGDSIGSGENTDIEVEKVISSGSLTSSGSSSSSDSSFSSSTSSSKIVISEVNWAGSDLSTADEWIEVVAIESGASIQGWTITSRKSSGEEAILYQFESGFTVSSGQYLIIANNNAEESRLLHEPDIVTKAISLPNTKLLLRIRDASGSVIDQVDDGVGVPFAGENASGTGTRKTMERINLFGSGALKENWRTAETSTGFDIQAPMKGTPGIAFMHSTSSGGVELGSGADMGTGMTNVGSGTDIFIGSGSVDTGSGEVEVIPPPVFLNEILANPIGKDDIEWIELINQSSGAISLSGWKLQIESSSRSYTFPASGSLLESGAVISLRKSDTGLTFRNKGDTVHLFSGDLIVDSLEYPEATEGVSYGRFGSGAYQLFCLSTEESMNKIIDQNPQITIQNQGVEAVSGAVIEEGKVTVNLQATVQSGSLAGAECNWDYGNGFLSQSCNPPSHTFREVGDYTIQVKIKTICGEEYERSLLVKVEPKPTSTTQKNLALDPKLDPSCSPTAFNGIVINEALPNPYDNETEGEWIELQNATADTVHLCGWSIDDEEGGSKPYRLDGESINPLEYLLLPRAQTKIALNNDADEVRLFAPHPGDASAQGSGFLAAAIPIYKAVEGESYALRQDGNYVWTPYVTPQQKNAFRTAERRYPTDTVVVSAALPNPVGKDLDGEWIEITNVSSAEQDLTGWLLDNKQGGSKPYELLGIRLYPGETKRFGIGVTKISLVNTQDTVRLLDPDGYTVSIFGWKQAEEGKVYRRPQITTERAKAKVVHVVDGDTVDIVLTDLDQLPRLPASLKRRWIGPLDHREETLRVRMIGIDTPETVHPHKGVERFGLEASAFAKAMLLDEEVELEFESEIWDKYGRLLAYIYAGESMVQEELLKNGLAYAYLRFPFLREDAFVAYELEAKQAKLGIWSDDEIEREIEDKKEDEEEEELLEVEGLTIDVNPASGRVGSGTEVTFTPSVDADVYLSVDSGSYQLWSGSFLVEKDTTLRVFAQRSSESSASSGSSYSSTSSSASYIKSDIYELTYLLERESYELNVLISEIYPSPNKDEQEWIEFYNPTDQDQFLAGWLLDDLRDGGSKPWIFPGDIVVPASGYLVLTKEQTGLNLNNDGDEVLLISPDGETESGVTYEKVRKVMAVDFLSNEQICYTTSITKEEQNICSEYVSIRKVSEDSDDTEEAEDAQEKRSRKKKAKTGNRKGWRLVPRTRFVKELKIKYRHAVPWVEQECEGSEECEEMPLVFRQMLGQIVNANRVIGERKRINQDLLYQLWISCFISCLLLIIFLFAKRKQEFQSVVCRDAPWRVSTNEV